MAETVQASQQDGHFNESIVNEEILEDMKKNRIDHMKYLPDMEQLEESDVMDQVISAMNAYDYDKYTEADVRRALAHDNRTPEDFQALLSPAALPLLEEIAQAARIETRKHFGNSVCMFTPIYIANYCENYCIYCGFNCHNKIRRAQLNEEEIELIRSLRPGLIQLEIGIQSTNKQTIKEINRSMNLEKVRDKIARIHEKGNVHQHLDLIAGLPYENYDSFAHSFNEVYAMEPDQFQLGFLSGFLAEKRDIEKKQIEKKVQQEARESAEKLMREQINGYSSVSVKNADFRALKEKWSYTLLPVWTITYKAKNGKIYYFSMNGQTGKVYGELPIDYKKISLVSGIVSLISLVILLLGGLA